MQPLDVGCFSLLADSEAYRNGLQDILYRHEWLVINSSIYEGGRLKGSTSS